MDYLNIAKLFDFDEPMVLFVGKNFDIESNFKLLNLPWSCIYSSGSYDDQLVDQLNNEQRLCRMIFRAEDIRGKILDKKNLKVMKLFSDNENNWKSTSVKYEMKKNAKAMINKIPQLIQYIGNLVVVGYSQEDNVDKETFLELILSIRQESVFYVGEIFDSEFEEIFSDKHVHKFESLDYSHEEYDFQVEDDEENSDYNNKIYISGKLKTFEKRDFFEVERFAKVLNYSEVMELEIPPYLYQNYFYAFIKNSSFEPQWYGYKCGFNLERNFEKSLYTKVVNSLNKPSNDRLKPILITGQTGCGKSVACANLAYRIFKEKEYPVIYMNNINIDFSPNIIRLKGETSYNNSPQLIVLDELIQKYETLGAKNILIVWDGSAYLRDREKYKALFNSLRNKRGHNLVFVGTAYETSEDISEKNFFELISVGVKLEVSEKNEDNEISKLRTLLKRKAKLDTEQISEICTLIDGQSIKYNNIMSLFYYLFFDVRVNIEGGVQREAELSLKDVLKQENKKEAFVTTVGQLMQKAGFSILQDEESYIQTLMENDIKKFLILVAICSQYNLAMPSRMAFSIINTSDSSLLRKIMGISFFDYIEEYEYDFCIRIRTKLEAEILLRSYHITPEEEVSYVAELIGYISEGDYYNQNSEIAMVTNLLYRMGPNSGDRSIQFKFGKLYMTVAAALEKIRIEKQLVNPSLCLQEITYMREYCSSLNTEINDVEKIVLLKKAINIGDTILGLFSRNEYSNAVRDSLTIETANSRLKLCALESSYRLEECERAMKDTMDVIVRNPDNIYAYHACLELAIVKYEEIVDQNEKLKLLADMCEIVDRVREENAILASNLFFISPAERIYSLFEKADSDEYFEDLTKKGNYAGIYLKAKKLLINAGIDNFTKDSYSEEQIEILKMVCSKLLENKEYVDITLKSYQCQYLRLKAKWVIYNKIPMFHKNGKITKMTNDNWKEIKEIAEYYVDTFVNNGVVEANNGYSVMYILALCYAQLDDFKNCMNLVMKIRRDTEWFGYDNRARVKQFICDSHGKLKTFSGNFTAETTSYEDKGYVRINVIKPEWNSYRDGIYFHKHNIRNIEIKSGGTSNEFQLGLAYMGFSVFHGYYEKEDTKNEL